MKYEILCARGSHESPVFLLVNTTKGGADQEYDMAKKPCEVGVIAPDSMLCALFGELSGETPVPFIVREGFMEGGVAAARSLVAQGTNIIISRGETCRHIRNAALDAVILEIPIPVRDVISLINAACAISTEIGIVGFGEVYQAADSLAPILPVSMRLFRLGTEADIPDAVQNIMESGLRVIAGTPRVVQQCEELGLTGFALNTRKAVALDILEEAAKIAMILRKEKRLHIGREVVSKMLGGETFLLDSEGKLMQESGGHKPRSAPQLDAKLAWAVRHALPYEGKITIGDSEVHCRLHPIVHNEANLGNLLVVESADHAFTQKKRGNKFSAEHTFGSIVHKSACMKECVRQAQIYAGSDATVCIRGESGTGKEMLAQAMHNASARRNQPFMAINCGAVPESLLASELFGYSRGAFTGARNKGRAGLLELADGGTVFLDEINEAPPSFQVHLLRFLEEFRFFRIGDEEPVSVNVRIICASNANLEECVQARTFRSDLYYRIHVLPLMVPPLRKRRKCLPLLMEYFRYMACASRNDGPPGMTPQAMRVLRDWHYPGNVRELRNLVERMVILADGGVIDEPLARKCLADLRAMALPTGSMAALEREHIRRTLEECGGNRSLAAQRLGISKTTLWRRLKGSPPLVMDARTA